MCFFFFKQKTAYEMRISDWSSDVCSSDLLDDMTRACALQEVPTGAVTAEYAAGQFEINLEHVDDPIQAADDCVLFKRIVQGVAQKHGFQAKNGKASGRERGCQYV